MYFTDENAKLWKNFWGNAYIDTEGWLTYQYINPEFGEKGVEFVSFRFNEFGSSREVEIIVSGAVITPDKVLVPTIPSVEEAYKEYIHIMEISKRSRINRDDK